MIDAKPIACMAEPRELSRLTIAYAPRVDEARREKLREAVGARERFASLVFEWLSRVEVTDHNTRNADSRQQVRSQVSEHGALRLVLREIDPDNVEALELRD